MTFSTSSVNSYPVSQDLREPFATGEDILQELSLFPKSKALIDEAQNALQECGLPNLEIRLEQTKSGFEAEKERNIIRIIPGLSAPLQLSKAVFELHNVISDRNSMALEKAAKNGSYKSAEEYAKAAEHAEFEGKISRINQITREINYLKQCKSNAPYIDNIYERFPDNVEFDHFYKVYITDDHKEHYRKEWKRLSPWGSRNCCSSKITCVAVTCVAIAIAVLGLSKMI